MNKTRREMMRNGQNMKYCKPFAVKGLDGIMFVSNEGRPSVQCKNSKLEDLLNLLLANVESQVFYDDFVQDNDTVEFGCCDCPFFKNCEAMDEDCEPDDDEEEE